MKYIKRLAHFAVFLLIGIIGLWVEEYIVGFNPEAAISCSGSGEYFAAKAHLGSIVSSFFLILALLYVGVVIVLSDEDWTVNNVVEVLKVPLTALKGLASDRGGKLLVCAFLGIPLLSPFIICLVRCTFQL